MVMRLAFTSLCMLGLLQAQSPQRPLYVRAQPILRSVDNATPEPQDEGALRALLAPVLRSAGYRLTTLAECESSDQGEILEAYAVGYRSGIPLKGMEICLTLRPARQVSGISMEALASTEYQWTFPTGSPLAENSLRRETLRMAAALLSQRVGRPVDPGPLPDGPELPLPPVRKGFGPILAGAPQGVVGGVAGGVVGGVVGGKGKVVDFEYQVLKVRYQPPPPPYPPVARAARIMGLVIVEVVINPEGIPVEARAIEGPTLLKKYAEDYAMQWRFEPTMWNGQPQWAKFKLEMPFKLTVPKPPVAGPGIQP